jgi:TonB-dependent SusC/RagA subfamily outer membrane receptor
MLRSYWSSFLSITVLLGFASACAHGNRTSQSQPEQPAPSAAAAPHQTVTSEDIDASPGESIEQILMARFPNITAVRTSDGQLALRIRGGSSIEGDNTPLYVIDGVPVNAGPYGGLHGINPKDIDTIEVLTDAVSESMYGMRGANGVIVIKTKRPGPR